MRRYRTIVPAVIVLALIVGLSMRWGDRQPGATDITPDQLRFANPDLEHTYRALRAHFVAQAEGWHHPPLRQGGNFLTETWCSPEVSAEACTSPNNDTADWQGARMFRLAVLLSPPATDVFGLIATASANPLDSTWGVHAHVSLTDGGVTVDQIGLLFRRFTGSERNDRHTANGTVPVPLADLVLSTGDGMAYRVADTDFTYQVPGSSGRRGMIAELARSLTSASSLSATYVAHNAALRDKVLAGIRQGEAFNRVFLEEPQNGIPPPTEDVPLDAAEQAEWLASAADEFAAREAAITANAEAIHGVLSRLLPEAALAPYLD
jgi:hypothetical protein